jgi:hypothetical protein
MIIIAKKDLKNKDKLLERKAYLRSLLEEPRSTAGPSSQEWVSYERFEATCSILSDEIREIDAVLKKL